MDVVWTSAKVIFLLLALYAMGFFMILKPELIWKLNYSLLIKNGEPSDFYLMMMRLVGVVVIFLTVFLTILFQHYLAYKKCLGGVDPSGHCLLLGVMLPAFPERWRCTARMP